MAIKTSQKDKEKIAFQVSQHNRLINKAQAAQERRRVLSARRLGLIWAFDYILDEHHPGWEMDLFMGEGY